MTSPAATTTTTTHQFPLQHSDHVAADGDVVRIYERPKRPLSAYNLFFQAERKKLLADRPGPSLKPRRSHGKMGFSEMAKTIAGKWKTIDPDLKEHFSEMAKEEKQRYRKNLAEWKQYLNKSKKQNHKQQQLQRHHIIEASPPRDNDPPSCVGSDAGTCEADLDSSNHSNATAGEAPRSSSPPQQSVVSMQGRLSATHRSQLNQGIARLAKEIDEESLNYFIAIFQS